MDEKDQKEEECVRGIEIEGEEKEKKFDHAGKFNQNWLEDISL